MTHLIRWEGRQRREGPNPTGWRVVILERYEFEFWFRDLAKGNGRQ